MGDDNGDNTDNYDNVDVDNNAMMMTVSMIVVVDNKW